MKSCLWGHSATTGKSRDYDGGRAAISGASHLAASLQQWSAMAKPYAPTP